MSRADGNSGPLTTTAPALRAARTMLTPPGMQSTSTASPPAAGNRHNDAGGLSLLPTFSPVGRDERNSKSPSAVNAGLDSPLEPRVSRRAGLSPAGSSSHTALRYSVFLWLSS